MYVYIRTEPGLWTVGFYSPDGAWHTDSDHNSSAKAAERVHYLNGGGERVERDTGLVGKTWLVESPNFEGLAEALSVNDDDTVNMQSDNGAIHIVTKGDLADYAE